MSQIENERLAPTLLAQAGCLGSHMGLPTIDITVYTGSVPILSNLLRLCEDFVSEVRLLERILGNDPACCPVSPLASRGI